MKTVLLNRQQSLVQWVSQATGISTFGVKVRLQGNDLHILCEGRECPQRWRTLSDLLKALQQTDLDILTTRAQPTIYQVFVYGRKKDEDKPQWCHRVYLNQLDRHLKDVSQALLEEDAEELKTTTGALILSNESLARKGNPDAVARYLSETLSNLGVAVQVNVKKQQSPENQQHSDSRLWIVCNSGYTPDPSLIAETIAEKLRYLELPGYSDAVIASQVIGETKPDWLLRVDLTPSEIMLKEWARWGDVQAISRLLTEALSESKVKLEITLKESTLHIFCMPAFDMLEVAPVPNQTLCIDKIASVLEVLAPQGIISAAIYGQKTGDNQPTWVNWLSLPASEHPALAVSPLELASSGDETAITFLLERMLNPKLDLRLATGGIRVLLLHKGDLLHIMCDAPVCPGRKKVVTEVTQFIGNLKIPGITGVRVYGRRAGNKKPFWQYGVDFEHRQRLVPEAAPEFAATSAHIDELLSSETDEPVLRPDLTTQEIQTIFTSTANSWRTSITNLLLKTQLLVERDLPQQRSADYQGLQIALVWGTLGLLLTLQADWLLGTIIARTIPPTPTNVTVLPKSSPKPEPSSTSTNNQAARNAFFADTSDRKSSENKSNGFNSSGFTQTDDSQLTGQRVSEDTILTTISDIPTFNSKQLDQQVRLYRERLLKTGSSPDVLIIGSSRALRGIDPLALSKSLASSGYPNVDVFNFGINGATAQVVDFLLRRILASSELPKLILWADGSRAFNSGRDDVTFNGITASPGYKHLLQQVLSNSSATLEGESSTPITTEESLTPEKQSISAYQSLNERLNKLLGAVSSSYQHRNHLKNLLRKKIKSLLLLNQQSLNVTTDGNQINLEEDKDVKDVAEQVVDFDGFLSLSNRFHPITYYQKHPKVLGNYDSDYKSFNLGGKQDAALQAVLEFTRSHQIPLVFINMPLTSEYLDKVRIKYEQEFQQYMLRVAQRPNFIYRDLSLLWPKNYNYFSDPSHLNRYGAYEISKKLASDPMIPWPTK
jgi:hypothetical protein